MIPVERHKLIVEIIEQRNSVTVTELCERLDVSDVTIRRDLRLLEDEGLLKRVYGGAVSRRGRSYEPPYLVRTAANIEQKVAIGKEAAQLVQKGDSIAIDIGTTTHELAKCLVGTPNLTIITASLPIAAVLAEAPNIRLIVSGGIVRNQEHSMIGHIPVDTFQKFHLDKAFIGIGGLDLDAGLTEYNLEDALVKQAIIRSAEQVIVVADGTKLGQSCFASVAPLSVVDMLVTDVNAPPEIVEALGDLGIKVIFAQTPG